MREALVVGLIASGFVAIAGYLYVGRPYLDRRRLQIAQEEVKILLRRQEVSDVSKSSKTTDR